jgi:hypothetical protein
LKGKPAVVPLVRTEAGNRAAGDLDGTPTPVYFLATKLEAFLGRGNEDYSGSHDLEDLIAVIDGRTEIVNEVRSASSEVRSFIASEMRRLVHRPL